MYKPLPHNITIKESPIEGLGLFATEKITAQTLIGITHHADEHAEDGWIRTPLGGFINHSDEPNCEKVKLTFTVEEDQAAYDFNRWKKSCSRT